ncbi:MAG: HAMP domain-containing sensor histidine kinase [Chitinophagaceae bacterium]
MKLFTRYNRLNLLSTVIIFVLTSITYYYLLRYVIITQLDDDLKIEKDEIINFAGKFNHLPEIIPVKEQMISFHAADGPSKDILETEKGYDYVEKENSEFRKLYFTFQIKDKWYTALVGKSMEATENLIQSIVIITICMILLILAASLIINRLVLNKLWQPFYKSLLLIKNYKVGSGGTYPLPDTEIEEFSFMNSVLRQATLKADYDFLILKEFTENASHEMQTPLAIIRSKLDLLIQDEKLSQHHGSNLHVLYAAIQKLTRLNKSLLLLTKIENNQFGEISDIDLAKEIKDKLAQFQEIIHNKKITVHTDIEPLSVKMNADLVDLLLNNLLSNAIKHNHPGGECKISLNSGGTLVIINTGSNQSLDTVRIFTRFYKEKHSNDDTGLGLSIVKQICTMSNCSIKYTFLNSLHSFSVTWES